MVDHLFAQLEHCLDAFNEQNDEYKHFKYSSDRELMYITRLVKNEMINVADAVDHLMHESESHGKALIELK